MNDRIRDVFSRVHAEEELKEHTREFLHQKLYEKRRRINPRLGYVAAVLSLFLVPLAGGYKFYFTPVSYISIDVNPSIELGLNRLDRIISITPYNDDGVTAVKNLKLKNLKYEDAVLVLLDSNGMSAYLTKDAQVSISVASDYQDKNEEIQERVMACTGKWYGNVSCHESSEDEMQDAHHEGVSFGKYRAYLELKSLDPAVTVDKVKGMSMHQIQKMIESYSGEAGDDTADTEHETGHGHNKKDTGGHGHR